jgi:RNA polymerase sigma-70 factor, ECF subfamily
MTSLLAKPAYLSYFSGHRTGTRSPRARQRPSRSAPSVRPQRASTRPAPSGAIVPVCPGECYADDRSPDRHEPEDVVTSEELVERCRGGDREAFRLLFRAHRSEVHRLVQRMLGGTADHEDVVQEVFLQVHRSLKDFRGNSRFSTWLYRVTVNVVLMQRRAARSRPMLQEMAEHQVPEDGNPAPDEQVARLLRIRAFYRVLDRLSDKKRVVFVLHEIEGMSPAEIAQVVQAPVLTVRTRLFYARREVLEALGEEPALAAIADELRAASPSHAPSKEPVG